MKFTKLKIIVIVIIAVVFTGCNKSEVNTISNDSNPEYTEDNEYSILELDGVVYADKAYEYSLPIDTTINEIVVRNGEFVQNGDLLYTVDDCEYLTNLIKYENSFNNALEYSDGFYRMVTISARNSGYVFDLTAEDGLNLYEEGGTPLCTIAKDRMTVEIADNNYRQRDRVTVMVNGEQNTGTIMRIENGTAYVEITKSYYGQGTEAVVYTEDKSQFLGKGELYYSSSEDIYYFEGYVTNVYVNAGDYVNRGDKICAVYIPSSDMWDVYTDILATETGVISLSPMEIGDSVGDIQMEYGCIGEISSDENALQTYKIQCPIGEIVEIDVENGEEVEKGKTLLTIKSPSRTIQQNYANIEDYYTEIRQLSDYNMYGAVTAAETGVLTNINYDTGDTVSKTSAVLSISTTEDYYVSATADISYIDAFTANTDVLLTFKNNIQLIGSVAHIDYNTDDDLLNIKIAVPETTEVINGEILPGMTCVAKINY